MDINRYLTMTCTIKHIKADNTSEQTQQSKAKQFDSLDNACVVNAIDNTEENVPCFKTGKSKQVLDANGQMRQTCSTIWFAPTTDIKVGDIVDDFIVQEVLSNYRFDGSLHHYEVSL